ncbi:MAG: IS110 family transposase [Phycisphaerae bacterium]|nr:IS110 family transposase [candidate division KSB1 bacterium]NIU55566.1 IS110 family transposase [Phycisphaerae bacterium]NIR70125.1 IS110 family transposase [candidate division KSB1 bacterium]NIS24441.1 IS110 family transposase [candidate division KSB1 bacterium]NIT71377.1 IS110 family transposase [candidate division KSB1 bacterium]
MSKHKKNKQLKEIPKLESLKQINFNAGGIDIASAEIWVCVPEDRDPQPVRRFDTFTADLQRAAAWLKRCGVDTVAMESTGIYWIPMYEILEAQGIEVFLVNAHEVKNVPGRKSDILDCQWLQQLHTYGLLHRSFIPDQAIRKLRDLGDHRDNLVRHRGTQIQYMQKALHLMNLQLDNVITDITGKTGMAIIRDIERGQRDPKLLAQHRDPNCKNPIEVIEKSLEGNYSDEHLFQLKQSLELYDFFSKKIAECEKQIEQHYKRFHSKANPDDLPPTHKKDSRTKNKMHFDLRAQLFRLCGVDLTAIDSVNAIVAHTVIAHTGVDMSRWKTEKHFTSWLKLCPKNDTSAGNVLRRSVGKTQNKATLALKQAAKSLNRSHSYLGAYYRRMKAIHGPAKAATAAAHKIARIIYVMLKEQKEFVDLGEDYFMQKNKERQIKKLAKKANSLGFYLVRPANYQRLATGSVS